MDIQKLAQEKINHNVPLLTKGEGRFGEAKTGRGRG
jgi:hypothetical protein